MKAHLAGRIRRLGGTDTSLAEYGRKAAKMVEKPEIFRRTIRLRKGMFFKKLQ
jgi:hypothetical protein